MDFDEILLELSYRVPEGRPDLTKPSHILELQRILSEMGVPNSVDVAIDATINYSILDEASSNKSKAAADKAREQGLEGKGGIAWGPVGKDMVTHKMKNGKLVKLDKKVPIKKQNSGKKKSKALTAADLLSKAEKEKQSKKEESKKPSRRINPDEGETIKQLSGKEVDSIIEKYVSVGESTSDEMGPITSKYSKQDMAEGYSDEEYYSKRNGGRGHSTSIRKEPYQIDSKTRKDLQNSGFPEKYIKFLERCINTQVKGKKPPVTDLIKQGGAGQIQSQFGEVMAMAFMSIRDKGMRARLANVINSEIKKSADEFGGGKASPIATSDWVAASLTHAEAFDSSMDEKYGKGRWKFDGAAWDIKDDIEALGLDYKDKGFSTDVMLRVQPIKKNGEPNGPARAQKCSLKKDEVIFFYNGSINEVNNFVLNFIPEKDRKRVRGYEGIVSKSKSKIKEERQAAIEAAERITGLKGNKAIEQLKNSANESRTAAFNNAPPDVQKSVALIREFPKKQFESAIQLINKVNTAIKNPNKIIDDSKEIGDEDKEFAKMSYEIVKKCKGSKDTTACINQQLKKRGEDSGDERICKVAVMATKVAELSGDASAKSNLSKHYALANKAGNALMEVLPTSPELMGGLMQKLAEAFPMKTCMDGEEFMLIDGMKVTQKTLQTVFGVNSYQELEKGLKLKKMPNGEYVLIYGGKGKNGKDIPMGIVAARQKGKGYVGNVGFEIACSDEFAHAISIANEKNGDASESNKKAINRIGSRLEKRKNKK